ncbi:MAG: DnaB-like helicase C-terminal domain-containing protein [Clostridia bacterium]|nr:DnaB-like helicase C-terminal domain-containing protein [Clostridia bacterium]
MIQPLEVAGNAALYARDAEASVLGGIAHSTNADSRLNFGKGNMIFALEEEDFWLPSNRKIYRVLRSLIERREPLDLITVDAEMERLYPNATGEDTAQLIANYTKGAMYFCTERYIEIVKEASVRRKLLAMADEIVRGAMDGGEDVNVLVDTIRARLRDMIQTQSAWRTMMDVMLSTFEDMEKRQKGEIKGIQSGVADVDRATGGFFPGELAVIGARPAVGKSAFGLQVALQASISGHKVCFISCEMVDSQFGQRVIASGTMIDGMKLRGANLSADDWMQVTEAMGDYSSLPISFTFGTKCVEDLRNDVQRKVDMGECDMVIIDYLQLLKTKRRFDVEHERVGYISHMLKQMTTDFKIPVVALAQAKRQNNNGRARCPVLDDLRSSGDIEQDADTVIFLHRPDDASDNTVDARDRPYFDALADKGFQYIVFSIAKQRQGQTGMIGAVFDPAHMRYYSMERVRR